MTPAELRSQIARGEWTTPIAGVLVDYQDLHLRQVLRSSAADLAPPGDQARELLRVKKSFWIPFCYQKR